MSISSCPFVLSYFIVYYGNSNIVTFKYYDGKLSADLGAREIRTNRFLSCNPLAGKPLLAVFHARENYVPE